MPSAWSPPAVRCGATPQSGFGPTTSQRLTLAELLALRVIHRTGTIQEFLDVAAGGGRRVVKRDSAGLAAGVLPRVRNVAREERAGAGSADGNLIADPKGDLAGEDPGDLVTVTMLMEQALCTGGDGFLEQHDALIGLVAEELQGGEAAGCRHVEMLTAAGGYDEAFRCVHARVLSGQILVLLVSSG